jgi:hypothetical protein
MNLYVDRSPMNRVSGHQRTLSVPPGQETPPAPPTDPREMPSLPWWAQPNWVNRGAGRIVAGV